MIDNDNLNDAGFTVEGTSMIEYQWAQKNGGGRMYAPRCSQCGHIKADGTSGDRAFMALKQAKLAAQAHQCIKSQKVKR